MADGPLPGAVVFAKDLPRVARFYEELAAMTVLLSDSHVVVLESPGFQLVLHAIPVEISNTFEIETPPQRRSDVPVKLFFPVASLARARALAATLGGAVDPVQDEWDARVFRACDGHDPEGNVVQFREPLRP